MQPRSHVRGESANSMYTKERGVSLVGCRERSYEDFLKSTIPRLFQTSRKRVASADEKIFMI